MIDLALTADVEVNELSEPISPKQPTTLAGLLTEFVARHEPGSRLHEFGTSLLKAHGINRDRRAAVLKHEDLAKRLTNGLGSPVSNYQRPDQWNGYIPPAVTDPGGQDRLCAAPATGGHGDIRYRLNQVGHYAIGETPNDSPRREALLDISREAWARERRAAVQAGEEQP